MFLRYKRSRGHDYLVLVENVWDGERVRQRTLYNYGRRERLDPGEVIRHLSRYAGYTPLKPMKVRKT